MHYYIEVVSNQDIEDDEPKPEIVLVEADHDDQGGEHPRGTLVVLLGAPRYRAFYVRGISRVQRVIILIDTGATISLTKG